MAIPTVTKVTLLNLAVLTGVSPTVARKPHPRHRKRPSRGSKQRSWTSS